MTKNKFAGMALAGLLAGAMFAAPLSAYAASAVVEQAKAQCVAGEQADGYLGIIDTANASAALRREVRSTNQKRKAVYAKLARANGVTIEVTAALTAEKLIRAAPRGHCVRGANGAWTEK